MATESSFETSLPAIKIGPCGGSGGSPQDITSEPERLQSITILSGDVIDSIGFSYLDLAGHSRSAGPWGGSGGHPHVIQIAANDFVTEVSGTVTIYKNKTVVSALKIVTNLNSYGPYGNWTGAPFTLQAQQGSAIVGMFARSAELLDAIGVYVRHI
ncbi:unnamed protein product [Urochloa humidicola]